MSAPALHLDDERFSPREDRRTATRADILDAVSTTCPGLSRGQLRDVFEMALEEVIDTLARGDVVKLRSFGLFAVREKRERVGRNPRTGVEVPITPRRVLTFRPSPVLLKAVNRHKAASTSNVDATTRRLKAVGSGHASS